MFAKKSIHFYKWFQAIPFVKTNDSANILKNPKKHHKTPWQTTPIGCSMPSVTAKNSDQGWNPVINKMHSRIVRGFFCARAMRLRVYSTTMLLWWISAGASKGAPRFFLLSGDSKPTLVCLPLSGIEAGSFENQQEGCTMFTLPHTGNPPNKPDKIPLSWRSFAVIPSFIPVALSNKFALSALFRRFISADVRLPASFVNA